MTGVRSPVTMPGGGGRLGVASGGGEGPLEDHLAPPTVVGEEALGAGTWHQSVNECLWYSASVALVNALPHWPTSYERSGLPSDHLPLLCR